MKVPYYKGTKLKLKTGKDMKKASFDKGEPLTDGLKSATKGNTVSKRYKY